MKRRSDFNLPVATITRPILGGGFMTALAVPLIDRIGLPAFTIATAAVAGALITWGIKRVGRQG